MACQRSGAWPPSAIASKHACSNRNTLLLLCMPDVHSHEICHVPIHRCIARGAFHCHTATGCPCHGACRPPSCLHICRHWGTPRILCLQNSQRSTLQYHTQTLDVPRRRVRHLLACYCSSFQCIALQRAGEWQTSPHYALPAKAADGEHFSAERLGLWTATHLLCSHCPAAREPPQSACMSSRRVRCRPWHGSSTCLQLDLEMLHNRQATPLWTYLKKLKSLGFPRWSCL